MGKDDGRESGKRMRTQDMFPGRVIIPQTKAPNYTPYSSENQRISDSAHIDAQRILYPRLFGVPFESMEFTSTNLSLGGKAKILDGEMAIDRLVKVSVDGLHCPLIFMIQERFRRPYSAKWRDLTITEWNNNTDVPSELYKLNAGIFLYGYHDPIKHDFIEAIAIDTVKLLMKIIMGKIKYTKETNPRTNQTFFGFLFDDLIECKTVIMRYERPTSIGG